MLSPVAIGRNIEGECNIPALDEGIAFTQVSAGYVHTVLLRGDGSAVAVGMNTDAKCRIPSLQPGVGYIADTNHGRDLALQLELLCAEDAVTLMCPTLAGEGRFRLTAQGTDSA